MTDLFWDEVLLTNNPDSKELEVSFKKIDGDGFLKSAGDEPGTPSGAEEGSDGSQPDVDDEGDFVPEDDEDTGSGDPIPPSEPPIECDPGNDCEARWSFDEVDVGRGRDSILLMRDGYEDHSDGYFSFWTQQEPADLRNNEPADPPNGFILKDRNGNEVFNGDSDSSFPTMGGEKSTIVALDSIVTDPNDKYTTPASPSNQNESNKNNNSMQFYRFRWPELDADCGGGYFCAPEIHYFSNKKRWYPTGSAWERSAECPDPTDVPSGAKWVGEGADNPGGDSIKHETWDSIFIMRPYAGSTPLSDIYSTSDSQWPDLEVGHSPPHFRFVHNGLFGGNKFNQYTYSGGSSIRILRNGRIQYNGSSGNGGFEWFDSRFWLGYDLGYGRDLDAWITCHTEYAYDSSKKDTNESGDYGIYGFGVTRLVEKWDTWYYNGHQITPRFLTSQFVRPQASHPPSFMEHDPLIPIHEYLEIPDAQQRPGYVAANRYTNGIVPLEFHSDVNATWMTYPISTSSRWDANFNDDTSVSPQYVNERCGDSFFWRADYGSYKTPVLAYVDHSEAGKGFFSSDAFRNFRKMTPRYSTPDYCERIPS